MGEERLIDPIERAKQRVGETWAGKWELLRLVGCGGMAAVYAARAQGSDTQVALKILHPEHVLDSDSMRRFQREGYIAHRVQHAAAVAVLDDGVTADGTAYLVMELLEGETLWEAIERRGELDELSVLPIALRVLEVLEVAHAQGIVHRDIKPDNVFLLADGGVKLLDFGIARLRSGLSGLRTQAGMVLGTPSFMSPEQARGQSEQVDARTDLWALGAVMVMALTGKRVHDANTAQQALFRAMTEPVAPMAELAPQLSPGVAALIDESLAFEAADRFADAASMRRAVQRALARLTTSPTAELAAFVLDEAPLEILPTEPAPPVAPRDESTPSTGTPRDESAPTSGTPLPVVETRELAAHEASAAPIPPPARRPLARTLAMAAAVLAAGALALGGAWHRRVGASSQVAEAHDETASDEHTDRPFTPERDHETMVPLLRQPAVMPSVTRLPVAPLTVNTASRAQAPKSARPLPKKKPTPKRKR